MNGPVDFRKSRSRRSRAVLFGISVVALLLVAAAAAGCGSGKKSASNLANGRHGAGIAYVKVLPKNQTLWQGVTTIIVLRPNLSFVVGVRNGGDFLEHDVKVTLVIHEHAPAPAITRTLTIPQIWNGATTEVDFSGPFAIRTMISVVPIDVYVHPVAGELNTVNNKATYKVRFAFGVAVSRPPPAPRPS